MHKLRGLFFILSIGFVLAGIGWSTALVPSSAGKLSPQMLTVEPRLHSGDVATMNSLALHYSPGWFVHADGADPREPLDPWHEPAGVITFTYVGSDLALQLATGAYWGYLYVTVDHEPANLLAVIPGNPNSLGMPAGYRTFYEPENQGDTAATARWVRVHQADSSFEQEHQVRIEVWRSWEQRPLRAVAVDALPVDWPQWPGMALLVAGGWLWLGVTAPTAGPLWSRILGRMSHGRLYKVFAEIITPRWLARVSVPLACSAFVLLMVSVASGDWRLCLLGLLGLAYASMARPVLWFAALLFGLPFYFSYTLPILPTRAFSLIDVGVFGGVALLLAQGVFPSPPASNLKTLKPVRQDSTSRAPHSAFGISYSAILIISLCTWSLIAAYAAEHRAVALHEWRTVFLSAGLFALVLACVLRQSKEPGTDCWLLIGGWLAGSTFMAAVGLWHYFSNTMLITAEGVYRVRGFYGSPNNLALYLERSLAIALALTLFPSGWRWRAVWGVSSALQLAALFLTFSKGGILLGLPALLFTLWLGGLLVVRQRGESTRLLWWLAGLAGLVALGLAPFWGTERFQHLVDFSQGTGFIRIQLWRSAWQMALDHPLLGVGPDNFLYAYRSQYILPAAWQEPNLNHPHNLLLDWWTRLGLPGLLLALLFYAQIVHGFGRKLLASKNAAVNLGLLAATAAALAHGLIDTSYALPDLMLVWGFFLVLATQPQRDGDDNPVIVEATFSHAASAMTKTNTYASSWRVSGSIPARRN